MFGSFLNFLYPSKKFLTAVLSILNYDPSTYDIDELNEQMNKNEQCEILNCSININELNKKIKLKKFFIGNLLIKKTNFVFKRNYIGEKTILSFEDINIDIYQKTKIDEKEEKINEQKEKSEGGLLDNLINTVVHNLLAIFKNIKIRFFDKTNSNIEYAFFIKKIEYKENENVEPIKPDEKIKYLFLHNKAIFIDGLLLKEKYDEKDEIFFSNEEKDKENINKFVLHSNNLFYIKNKIEIDIFFDKDNNNLTIGNKNNSDFYIENIFSIQQLNALYKYFNSEEKDKTGVEDENNIKDNKDVINCNDDKKEDKKSINIMGYKIEKINFELKIWLFYFILMENNNNGNDNREKLWVSHQENLIKNDENNNVNDTVIKHFNSVEKKYCIFFINNLFFSSKNKKLLLNELILTKNELKDIKNNNDKNNININIINTDNKFDFEEKNIFNINKLNLDLESKKYLYDNIYFEITPNLFYFIKIISNIFTKKPKKNKPKDNKESIDNKTPNENKNLIENKENNKDNIIIINTDEDQINEEKKDFIIDGKNLNIKIYINNNKEEENNGKDLDLFIDDIFINKDKDDKDDYIDFIITNLTNNKVENTLSYDKIDVCYIDNENKKYTMVKIIESENILENKNIIINNNQHELLIDLKIQILIFINPNIINNILNYTKFVSKLFEKKEIKNINNSDNNLDNINNAVNINNIDNIDIINNIDNKKNEDNINIIDNMERIDNIDNIDNLDGGSDLDKLFLKNFNFILEEVKIFIINEKEDYLNILKAYTDLQDNNIVNIKNYNYICAKLNEIGLKLEKDNNNIMKCNAYLKSFIIEDNISKSIYKILLSNYYFKNKEQYFINCVFEITKIENNKYEIRPSIKISPIAIYLDQVTLYYLFNSYIQIKIKKDNENLKENINQKVKENIFINDNYKYIIDNTNIDIFFIQINYNSNNKINDKDFLESRIIKIINSISLINLNIDFREYKNENNKLPIKQAIKDIYEFYYEDIKNQVGSGSLVPALPLLNHFSSIIDGAFDIVREPVHKYRRNESIIDGFVVGTNNFVVNTATIFTYMGESLFNFFDSFSCTGRSDLNVRQNNLCRRLRYKFNEKNKEIEDFYFK